MLSPSVTFQHHCLETIVEALYGIIPLIIQYFHARDIECLQAGEAPEEVRHRLHLRIRHLQSKRPHAPELRRQSNSAHRAKQCGAKLQLRDPDPQIAEHLQPRRMHYIYRWAPVDVVREEPLQGGRVLDDEVLQLLSALQDALPRQGDRHREAA